MDFGYDVSIAPTGRPKDAQRVVHLYGAIRNEEAYGANLVWINDHTLEVRYLQAKDCRKEQNSPVSIDGIAVTVRLRSGIRDDSAPAGGMVYNLEPYRR